MGRQRLRDGSHQGPGFGGRMVDWIKSAKLNA